MAAPRKDRRCSVEGCDKPHQARGLCWAHYQRLRRNRSVDVVNRVGSGSNALWTRCKHGHPLEGDNLYVATDGRRRCLTCKRARDRQYAAELRAMGINRHRRRTEGER